LHSLSTGAAPKPGNPQIEKGLAGSMLDLQEVRMKYVVAAILLVIAIGAWGAAFGIYYSHDWGGTPAQVCSRTDC
jgi:hypothetical protein